jgi:mannose/fructose/N-acetylgalactosamine-specific phosphotransferase system component IID
MKKTIKFITWLVCFTLAFNLGLDLLNESSTIANIIGLFIVGTAITYSVQTGCFYTFKNKNEKKDEEDNQEN